MNETEENDRMLKIRDLNDKLRQSGKGGKIFITQGVQELPPQEQAQLIGKVMTFKDFIEGDDPYGEHNFGAIKQNGVTYYWKIDYYDNDLLGGSKDPSDPKQTRRVLTILQAIEY
jgi:hypothetical protein